jgi:hypothetical protein
MMRLLSILTLIAFSAIACGDSNPQHISTDMIHVPATAGGQENSAQSFPEIQFTDTVVDLGNLVEGQSARAMYAFRNTGNAPLVIADVSTSCGCTVARNWPREPLQRGEERFIEVTFDSRKRPGANEKSIFVVTNAHPSTIELKLKAWVIGPESDPASIPSTEN